MFFKACVHGDLHGAKLAQWLTVTLSVQPGQDFQRGPLLLSGVVADLSANFSCKFGGHLTFPAPPVFMVLNFLCFLIMLWTVATGTSYCFEMAL